MLETALHESSFLRYEVNILEKPFRNFSKTVIIAFFDESGKKVEEAKYGFLDSTEIFQWIDEGKEINLSGAYVKNFSLTDYRVEKGWDDSVFVKLNQLNAKKAFFDADVKTDFSFAEFLGVKTVFESAIFANAGADFNNANFGDGDAIFKKVKFGSGYINFQFATFGQGVINFNNACFGNGNVSFVSTGFGNGNVDFKNTVWGDGIVDFKFAKFSEGDISFEKARFGKGKKDFKNLEFGGGKIDFRRVNFNDGDVSFNGVEFGTGKVSFKSAVFGQGEITFEETDFGVGEVLFDQVQFGDGKVSFNNAKGDILSFRECPLNAFFDFRFSECNKLDLSNTIVRDILDLIPQDEKVHIKEFLLVGMRILGRIFVDWRINDVFSMIYIQKDTTMWQKAEQFRILKENFRNNGQYDDEDLSYIEFKRCQSKAQLEEAIKVGGKTKFFGYLRYWFQYFIFDAIGHYATNPVRVIYHMGLTFTIFSLIYYVVTEYFPWFGSVATTLPQEYYHLHDFWNSFYYSAITFFTIGYGDYFAEGYLKFFAALEGFTGVFLMSYFTVAFVRKILR
jgi:hypothetical protein